MVKSRWKFAASALALAIAAPAFGQSVQDTPPEVENEIVVTGTYIQGTAKDTAIPLSVVSQEDIEKRGSPSVLDLIKTLPIAGPVLGDTNQFNAAANVRNGGGTINIRSLGAQRTLVLLNGRRFAAGTADTNLLPIAAIGRVEVLKDGAAATYGSDAIAGVANFITRTNVDGLEGSVDYRYVPGSDGGDYSGSLLYGYEGDGVRVLLSGAYQHRAELSVLERDWVLQPYLTSPAGWSGTGNPGAYTAYSGPGGTGTSFGYNIDANCTAVGGFSGFAGTAPVCYYQYMPFDNLVENTDQYQFYGEVTVALSDSIDFRVEALYASTKLPDYRVTSGYLASNGPTGPGTSFIVPSSNPGFNTFLALFRHLAVSE
ncbi:TonB-dependent receptor plug domain-containing protein [Sphingopyxis sp. 113P3]|uniref:TonB-dependent receptor plug domain-containing protein n=1 Tax=Sphingopyxis sp. (strain 113P3) TaxID=292913 RepID=UPI0006AD45FD|nr:TonB-dependent receptor plug domain-containing protein [Sphingopyxis sp. 113P3]